MRFPVPGTQMTPPLWSGHGDLRSEMRCVGGALEKSRSELTPERETERETVRGPPRRSPVELEKAPDGKDETLYCNPIVN